MRFLNFENPWDKNRGNKDDLDEMIKKGQKKLMEFLKEPSPGGDGGNHEFNPLGNFFKGKFLLIISLIIAVAWLSTGFYTVQPDEEGVILRFGKYARTSVPGLNYKLPYPVETVTKVSVTRVNKEEIGFRSSGKRITSREQLLENNVRHESQMLTTDENIVDINFEVQWVINDAKNFLFNVRDLFSENTVKNVAESAMREVIGLSEVTDVLAEERSKIEMEAKNVMQKTVNSYGMGVEIVRVQLLRVEPPQEVIDSYRDVQNAKQDKEREINRASAYRNDIIPRARGEAEKILQEAEGYKRQVTASAKGEAEKFTQVYNEYRKAKDVTRKRIYIETMEEIMQNMDKVILDNKGNTGVLPYLPLNELINKKSKN